MTADVLREHPAISLKARLQRAQRRSRVRAFLLVAPLFLFLLFTFVLPIGDMLFRSVENSEVVTYMPETAALIGDWDGEDLPSEALHAAVLRDLIAGRENRTIGKVGGRLNYEMPGARSLITGSARKAARLDVLTPARDVLHKLDARWADPTIWRILKQESASYTPNYFLAALDLKRTLQDGVTLKPDEQRIYVNLFWRTLWMSALITLLTLVLGYPVAFLLANLPTHQSNLLMILVLLPFWTSMLVRTTTWIVLLQSQGVINDLLVWVGLVGDDDRLQMIYNQLGTIIAMTHILLPFMILPLYSVMRTIAPAHMRAARSLGAPPWMAFRRVYMPQTLPGVGAGGILVFILSIGYYITPALVGGHNGRFITNMIAYHMNVSLNWGLAAAISVLLLLAVLLLYLLYNRLIGFDSVKLG